MQSIDPIEIEIVSMFSIVDDAATRLLQINITALIETKNVIKDTHFNQDNVLVVIFGRAFIYRV
jgi:hypothetical protein